VNSRHTVSVKLALALLTVLGVAPLWAGARASGTTALATRLDADGRADWIRAFPCGESFHCLNIDVSETHSTQSILLETRAAAVRIASRDVDGDGLPDLLVADAEGGAPLGVWLNDGQGGFTPSDATLYPESIWDPDPLVTLPGTPDDMPLAALDDLRDFCLDRPAASEPLLNAPQAFACAPAVAARAARFENHFGRAPPSL
jgi:hypothetical protein